MELKSKYFQVIFNNGKEFFIETTIQDDHSFLLTIEETGKHQDYISLEKVVIGPTDKHYNGNALNLKKSELFSVQEISKEMIGGQTKLWRLSQ